MPDGERCCDIDGIAELLDEHFVFVEGANGLIDPDVLVKRLVSILSLVARRPFCNRSLRKTTALGHTFKPQIILIQKW